MSQFDPIADISRVPVGTPMSAAHRTSWKRLTSARAWAFSSYRCTSRMLRASAWGSATFLRIWMTSDSFISRTGGCISTALGRVTASMECS